MILLTTIFWYKFFIVMNDGKYAPVYDVDFKHCEQMRIEFKSISKICIKSKAP